MIEFEYSNVTFSEKTSINGMLSYQVPRYGNKDTFLVKNRHVFIIDKKYSQIDEFKRELLFNNPDKYSFIIFDSTNENDISMVDFYQDKSDILAKLENNDDNDDNSPDNSSSSVRTAMRYSRDLLDLHPDDQKTITVLYLLTDCSIKEVDRKYIESLKINQPFFAFGDDYIGLFKLSRLFVSGQYCDEFKIQDKFYIKNLTIELSADHPTKFPLVYTSYPVSNITNCININIGYLQYFQSISIPFEFTLEAHNKAGKFEIRSKMRGYDIISHISIHGSFSHALPRTNQPFGKKNQKLSEYISEKIVSCFACEYIDENPEFISDIQKRLEMKYGSEIKKISSYLSDKSAIAYLSRVMLF